MSEKEFRDGDRVEYVGDKDMWLEYLLERGEAGVVAYTDDSEEGNMIVEFVIRDEVPMADFELRQIDPKTAFLTELSELLDKYDASIYVDFDQSDEIYTTTIAVGEDSVKYSNTYGIDTDNVLNYDK